MSRPKCCRHVGCMPDNSKITLRAVEVKLSYDGHTRHPFKIPG
jgi:hypothetical protein